MSRFQIGLLVVLGVIATVAAGVFSQGGPAAPDAAPVVEEIAEPDVQAEEEAARVAAEEAAEAARLEAERLAAEAAAEEAAETAWVVSAPLAAPELSVVRSGVGIYDADADEDAQPREIAEAEQAPVPTGGRVIVPGRGMAVLDWGGALRGELLRAASVTVDQSDLEQRRVRLDQSEGTVRYLMSMPGEEGPVGMTVAAGSVIVDSDTAHGDMADLLITHVPDPEATEDDPGNGGRTWVVVVAGAADVEFGGPVASTNDAAAGERSVRLEAGQGAAFATAGEAPTVMPMDLVAVETWYGQMLSGYRDSIAAFAFRCVITADEVALRAKPPAGGQIQTSARAAASRALSSLASGALVNVTHRTEDGLWLEVDTPELEEPAWMEADGLQCIAPLSSVPVIDQAYLAPATATPAVVAVSFTGADSEITTGKCTMLRWDVPAGSQITVDGQPMPGKGFQSVCPDRTTSYTLRWVDANGRPQERRLTVVVNEAPQEVAMADTGGNEDNDGDDNDSNDGDSLGGLFGGEAGPEPTICVGDECEVVLPTPLPRPTRRPRPTKEPEPIAPEPTDPPSAPEPTDPPSAPEPTDPPSEPDPTDPPATATLGAPTVTATAAVTSTATATATATATGEPAPTETPAAPTPEAPTATPEAPTATLEPPTQTPEPEPPTATPAPQPTATPVAF